jgi:hypothetical protein
LPSPSFEPALGHTTVLANLIRRVQTIDAGSRLSASLDVADQ